MFPRTRSTPNPFSGTSETDTHDSSTCRTNTHFNFDPHTGNISFLLQLLTPCEREGCGPTRGQRLELITWKDGEEIDSWYTDFHILITRQTYESPFKLSHNTALHSGPAHTPSVCAKRKSHTHTYTHYTHHRKIQNMPTGG